MNGKNCDVIFFKSHYVVMEVAKVSTQYYGVGIPSDVMDNIMGKELLLHHFH